jgi:peroxiredoxin
MAMPHIQLASTAGSKVDVGALGHGRTILYCYPRTGRPGEALPNGWDEIPGARGCTPEACAFRDHTAELAELGASVFGVSTQSTAYQREMVERLHLPFAILSDAELALTAALRLPTFEVDGLRLIKRLTLVVHAAAIEHVFYPVFPPDAHASEVAAWLRHKTSEPQA